MSGCAKVFLPIALFYVSLAICYFLILSYAFDEKFQKGWDKKINYVKWIFGAIRGDIKAALRVAGSMKKQKVLILAPKYKRKM